MPVGEAARVGAKQVARLLQTDVRELFGGRSRPESNVSQTSVPAGTTAVQAVEAVSGDTVASTQAAVALRPQPHPTSESATEPKSWWSVGEVALDLYTVEKVLTANQRVRVYRVRHRLWDVPLVLKIPGEELASDQQQLSELSHLAARWTQCGLHPHIAYCFTTHAIGPLPVIVIEAVEGGSLRQWMAAGRLSSLRLQLDVAIQVCHALEHAHSRALAHGGLKPENILLTPGGVVRVTDFGIASRCEELAEMYVAPEQWVDGGPSDITSDIFALGVCLYELFCNGRPYEVTRGPRRKSPEPTRPNGEPLPEPLAQLLQACVDWEPLRRPRSVAEIRLQIARLRETLYRQPSPFAALPPNTWDSDGWNNQGVVALAQGRVEEAEAAFETALAADPRHLEANFNLGVLRWRSGNGSDETILAALAGARPSPHAPERPLYLQALTALESGDGTLALELLHKLEEQGHPVPGLEELQRAARRCRPLHSVSRELTGHAQVVAAVAMSADGKWVLSGGDDHTLLLWDAFAGTAIRALEGHESNVTSLAMTPDGHWALSGSEDGSVKLWDLQRARSVKTLRMRGRVFALALSQDGRLAVISAAGSDNFLGIDGTLVDLWDLEKERPLRRLEGHSSAVKALAMTPDARRLATGGDDHKVVLWDLTRGQPLRTFVGHEHFVSCVAVSADGQHVASGSWDRTIRLWNARSGKCAATLWGHNGIVTCLRLNDDATLAVSGSWDSTVRVWDLSRQRCIRTLLGHRGLVTSVALAANARSLVSGSWDCTVRLWDLPQPGPEVCTPLLSWRGEHATLPPAELTDDEHLNAAWEAFRTGDLPSSLDHFRHLARSRDVGSDALRDLWTAVRPQTEIHRVEGASVVAECSIEVPLTALAYDTQHQTWLCTTGDGRLLTLAHRLDTQATAALRLSPAPLQAVVALPHSGVVAAAGFDRQIYLCPSPAHTASSPDNAPLVLAAHRSIVSSLLALNQRALASASYDHTVQVWDVDTRVSRATLAGHSRQVAALAMSPDASLLASGDLGGHIVTWEWAAGRSLHSWKAHGSAVRALAFLAGGDVLASGSDDGQLKLWRVCDGAIVSQVSAHEGGVTQILPLWDPRWWLTAGVDGTIRIWNTEQPNSGVVLHRSDAPIVALACTAEGWHLAFGDASGRVRLLQLHFTLSCRA
ncbi:MAG: hypothetical protein KatS3mg077_3326 [Candidatus Binatia bacterium]|nr:MAG: hypothetical protein KatS3mg077_3326 [Candidatus Binatia bacterium]